ncbi:DUF3990 domain-containing protein [Adlercreutzia sp. ZJ141]|uniref:DUF3990 domain-containing protein n=1 Tax=Adlercreutzia sp. ZJ141 TaxID=2709406 RepID=UPI0013EE2196|nr:DUF3990 domain-containing protein [Adlercreutzia sp. ZJ141]
MRVYHASPYVVESPDTVHSRNNLDFGRGFYVTTMREQAVSYARRFTLRKKAAFLNEYNFDEAAVELFKVLRFDAYDEDWLDFVMSCRKDDDQTDWDIVFGGIANDRVFTTVDLYFAGEITKQEALGRLAYEKPNDQLCIRNQKALDILLSFIGAKEL